MNVTHVCPACGAEKCLCRNSLAEFFRILSNAAENVSTTKPTSSALDFAATAGIDKLELELVGRWELIRQAWSTEGRSARLKRLNSGWFLELTPGIYVDERRLGLGIQKVLTNPNRFKSFPDFYTVLSTFITEDSLRSAIVKRLDLNLDYKVSLNAFLKVCDIRGKQSDVEFESKSGQITGIRVGKGTERINIYDRKLKDSSNSETVRLEVQLKGAKLPTSEFSQLQTVLSSGDTAKKYFGRFDLAHVLICDLALATDAERTRANAFQLLLEKDGYFRTRKHFNTNNNFQRDYMPLLKSTPVEVQPVEAFKNGIEQFFQRKDGETYDFRQARFS